MSTTENGQTIGPAATFELPERRAPAHAAPHADEPRRGAAAAVSVFEASPESGPRSDGARTRTSAPVTVLVVDDDACIRESLASILEDEGYAVHTAENGRAALAVLDRIGAPSLLLIDLRMPIMDGVELIEALRRDARYAATPLIAFSAASTVAPPPGVPFLAKPIGIEPLLDAVRVHARS